MTVPGPPLPAFADLLRALVSTEFSEAPWTDGAGERRAAPYRLGRYALAAAVEAAIRRADTPALTLWVPGYICNEALAPIRGLPVRLRFYPVDENLAPSWPALAVDHESATALVLVHYFGVPNATCDAVAFCRKHNMLLIEDAAHMIGPTPGPVSGDAMVFSPYKLLPVAECGVLVVKPDLHEELPARGFRSMARETVKWLLKRTAQKIMLAARISWHCSSDPVGSPPSSLRTDERSAPDAYTISLLSITLRQRDTIINRRRENYLRLQDGLRDIPGIHPFFPRLADGVCPYVLPLAAPGIVAHRLLQALRRRGIPASSWPDLPPEVQASPVEHRTAIWLYENVILLPVHQTLRRRQIEDMIGGVREMVSSGRYT